MSIISLALILICIIFPITIAVVSKLVLILSAIEIVLTVFAVCAIYTIPGSLSVVTEEEYKSSFWENLVAGLLLIVLYILDMQILFPIVLLSIFTDNLTTMIWNHIQSLKH